MWDICCWRQRRETARGARSFAQTRQIAVSKAIFAVSILSLATIIVLALIVESVFLR